MLNEFIEKVIVHEGEGRGNDRRQQEEQAAKEALSKELEKARYEKRKAEKRAYQSEATKKSRQKMYEEAATGNPEAVERYENYLVARREAYHRKKTGSRANRIRTEKQGRIVGKSKSFDFPTNADYYGIPIFISLIQ